MGSDMVGADPKARGIDQQRVGDFLPSHAFCFLAEETARGGTLLVVARDGERKNGLGVIKLEGLGFRIKSSTQVAEETYSVKKTLRGAKCFTFSRPCWHRLKGHGRFSTLSLIQTAEPVSIFRGWRN